MKSIVLSLILLLSNMVYAQDKLDKLVIDSEAMISENGVLTESFGIKIYNGTIAPFSKIGEKYPVYRSYTFSTYEDLQDQITLEFHRSAASNATAASFIRTIRVKGFKLEKAKEPLVRIHYELSNDKITIWATNEKKNGELHISVSE